MHPRKRFQRFHWLAGITCATLVIVPAVWADLPWSKKPVAETRDAEARTTRLNHLSAAWPTVLNELAESTGSTLVMEKAPEGRFSRRDRNEYTRAEAVRILNSQLELKGFRILEQGDNLVVINLRAVRTRYQPHVLNREAQAVPKPAVVKPTPYEDRRVAEYIRPQKAAPSRASQGSGIQLASHEEPEQAPLDEPYETIAVHVRNGSATDLSRVIYQELKPRAELVAEGPAGLPAFRVFANGQQSRRRLDSAEPRRIDGRAPVTPVDFTVGIDTQTNELVVAGPHSKAEAVAQLIEKLDVRPAGPGRKVQFVSKEGDVKLLAQRLRPTVRRLVAQQDPQAPATRGLDPAQLDPQQMQDQRGSTSIGGLKGDVIIEDVPGVGLVLRGNEEDIEKVMEVIRAIETFALGTTPHIHLRLLDYVNSAALAELLTSVYEELGETAGAGAQAPQSVRVVPVVKPNAVLIMVSENELPVVNELIDKLDRPVDPRTQFMVFNLRNAVAAQVVETIGGFYAEPNGLATRVQAVADIRTNSIIVQAQPRDLEEIASLIRRIDADEANAAVNDMKVFPLQNAIAEELANVLNQAIQSVLSPPASPQGAGGALGGQFAGAGQAQELRDARSAVLQFFTTIAGEERLVRSGVLSDIRISPDPRTNSLVVTAPRQSMELMAALIERFDRPTSTVADIKHIPLKNADATAVAELLTELFVDTDQDTPVGVQLAGTAGTNASLVPLRISVDVRTNSIVAVAGRETLEVIYALILRLDAGNLSERKTEVVKLKNTFASDVALAVANFMAQQRALETQLDPSLTSPFEQMQKEVIIIDEPVTNNLLISATPRYFNDVLNLVLKLDERQKQVTIQAMLVEVTLENTDEFGVELGFQDSVLFDRSVIDTATFLTVQDTVTNQNIQTTTQRIVSQQASPGFNFNNQPFGNNPSVNSSTVGKQALSNFSLGRVNGDLGFGGLVLSAGSEEVNILLRALSSRRRVDVLSRPQIRTLDNQNAVIQVGRRVPIVNGTAANALGGISPSIEQDDAGIILDVTPRITPDGMIVMNVLAEKSEFTGDSVPLFTDPNSGQVISSPIKDVTRAQASVAVNNNQTIVMGGMITKNTQNTERKVPWLGDIPIIGTAFRYDFTNNRRTELLIFLTPRIVDSDAESELQKIIETERIHYVQREAEEVHGPIFSIPDETAPGGPYTPPYVPPGSMDVQGMPVMPPGIPLAPPAPSQEGVPTTIVPPDGLSTYETSQSTDAATFFPWEEGPKDLTRVTPAGGLQPSRRSDSEIQQTSHSKRMKNPFKR